MKLSGRVAIVTGGGCGIGREFVHALAGEGARVVISDINNSAAEKNYGRIKTKRK